VPVDAEERRRRKKAQSSNEALNTAKRLILFERRAAPVSEVNQGVKEP
jgi:hypothetical protein